MKQWNFTEIQKEDHSEVGEHTVTGQAGRQPKVPLTPSIPEYITEATLQDTKIQSLVVSAMAQT